MSERGCTVNYHPDPDVDAEVAAEVLEAEKVDLAAGLSPRWWACPQCGNCHKRGHFGAIGNHRCLKCGYTGSGGIMGTDDEPEPLLPAGRCGSVSAQGLKCLMPKGHDGEHCAIPETGSIPSRVRGYMGGDVAGGCDVDDADREPECEEDERLVWRCFHCNEVFSDKQKARAHFGSDEALQSAACTMSAEHLRELEIELARYRSEDSDLDRKYHAMQADRAVALIRAEEAGYAKGLGDFTPALAIIAELCSAIETQSPSVTNEFVENARKRARDFLESVGKL
jgi:hypothetical protein